MTDKTRRVIATVILVPLLTFLLVGLLIFAWPVLVVAVVIALLVTLGSLFRRRRRAFA